MAQQILSTNTFTTAKWIVSATASDGTHTTIGAALTSASSGDTIFIRPGTYTENLTLKAGVNLSAYPCDAYAAVGLNPNVIILGKCTATFAGNCSISGIQLKTNSDFCLAVTGSAATSIQLKGCFIDANNNTAISFTSSSGAAKIELYDCKGDLDTTGIAYFTHSAAGALKFTGCSFENNGSSTTVSTCSAGGVDFYNCLFECPITTSSTSVFSAVNTQFFSAGTITIGGSGTNIINLCQITSDAQSAISVGSSLTLTLTDINSSNTNAITGAGTLSYSVLTFSGSSSKINTTTQIILPATAFQKVTVQTFAASGTYTPTAGMKYCTIEVIGGGGAGGGAATTGAAQGAAGGGGGGGGYSRKTVTAATIGTSQTVTVGAAGAAGSAGNVAGGNGGTTSVGAIISATGGNGGAGSPVSAATNCAFAAGGAGGGGSSGDFNSQGFPGISGFASGVTPTIALSGGGGSSVYGGGGQGVGAGTTSRQVGNPGGNYGAGGSGGYALISQSAESGGAGTVGLVVITEYI